MNKITPRQMPKSYQENTTEPIAIIGMGCRFPGNANTPQALWEFLMAGQQAVRDVPAQRWDLRKFQDANPNKAGKMRPIRGCFLSEEIWQFDPTFFGISPREASSLDPQQSLLLEVSWEAMETAGLDIHNLNGSDTGVFMGGFTLDAFLTRLHSQAREHINSHTATSSTLTMLANRVSHTFGFQGPSMTIDTACSSSLVALHHACRALEHGDCSLALCGGANLILRPEYSITMSKGGFLADDGCSKSFDRRADGYGRGEGVAVIVLKPLLAALTDGDPIQALIYGTGINHNGHTDGITVPNSQAQENLIRQVLSRTQITPDQVGYVEAHGTGTLVGDPLEAAALGRTYGQNRPVHNPCIIGSLKANIGHLEATAGIAGVIKAVLCLKNNHIPSQPGTVEPNPRIPFAQWGLELATHTRPLSLTSDPVYAAVNSFGFGGSNAHAILGMAPKTSDSASSDATKPQRPHLLLLSAHTPKGLTTLASAFANLLQSSPDALHDICYSAACKRSHHDYRLAIVGKNREDLIAQLHELSSHSHGMDKIDGRNQKNREIVFVYTGMGPQWHGMVRQLLEREPHFRDSANRCDTAFKKYSGWSLLEALDRCPQDNTPLPTAIAQPANTLLQIALTDLLGSWGLTPAAVVGHSVGEVAAAYAVQILDTFEAMRIVYHRSRLQQTLSGRGRMLAVGLGALALEERLATIADCVGLAAINSPTLTTLSGDGPTLEALAESLNADKIFNRFLAIDIPFHSPAMESILTPFAEALQGLTSLPPSGVLYSTVTGNRITTEPLNADYWVRNVRQPVLFAKAIATMIGDGHHTFLEVGPHPVLSAAIQECQAIDERRGVVFASQKRHQDQQQTLMESLGHLYCAGFSLAWDTIFSNLHQPGCRFIPMPSYPWQRQRYWQEPETTQLDRLPKQHSPLLGQPGTGPLKSWSTQLNAAYLPYLPHHRIHDRVVFPGACYVETGLALAHALERPRAWGIDHLVFLQALVIPEVEERILHTSFDDQRLQFTIHSRSNSEQAPWQKHAQGTLTGPFSLTPPPIDRSTLQCRLVPGPDPNKFYHDLAQRGLQYGLLFQTLEQIFLGQQEVLARIHVPPVMAGDEGVRNLAPEVLDAAFQSMMLLVENQTIHIPVGIERLRFFATPNHSVWSHARLHRSPNAKVRGEITLFADDGTVLAQLFGVTFHPIHQGENKVQNLWSHGTYATQWEKAPWPTPKPPGGRWVVLADQGGTGNQLIHVMQRQGVDEAILVKYGPTPQTLERFPDGSLMVAPHADALMALWQAVDWQNLTGIVCLWGLDASITLPVNAALETSSLVLELLQSLLRLPGEAPPKLALLTQGAMRLNADPPMSGLGQSPLAGLVEVAWQEHGRWSVKTIDLDPVGPTVDLKAVVNELGSFDSELVVAIRNGERCLPRLQRCSINPENNRKFAPMRPESRFSLEIQKPGGIENLFWREIAMPDLGPREMEVAVMAAALNLKDVLKALNLLPDEAIQGTYHQTALGMEASVVVTRVGSQVARFKPGDSLVLSSRHCLASHLMLSEDGLFFPTPALPHHSHSQGSGIYLVFITALYALRDMAQLKPGETVLIHSASGGVGLAAIQIAHWLGATVLATAGSEEKRNHVRSLGIQHVFNSRSLDYVDAILSLTQGRGVQVILNALSGEHLTQSFFILAAYGRFIEIGKRDIVENGTLSMRPFNRHVTFAAVDIDRFMQDHPQRLQELMDQVHTMMLEGILTPLPVTIFPVTQIQQAFRFLAQAKQIGKVTMDMTDLAGATLVQEEKTLVTIDPQASYLITGGFGGMGLRVAQWLADMGACHLILTGRRGAYTSDARKAVTAMTNQGVTILEATSDIAIEKEVVELLQRVHAQMPSLKGIFHVAGILDDDLLERLNSQRVTQVMSPKVAGSWYLHHHTQHLPVEIFVMFSSIVTLLANSGQAHYVAGNRFMDALAHQRHAMGLPALSINWGPISQIGMVGRTPGLEHHFQTMGLRLLTPDQAINALAEVINLSAPQIAIAPIDWSTFQNHSLRNACVPYLTHLMPVAINPAQGYETSSSLPSSSNPQQRLEQLEQHLTMIVGKVLLLQASEIDPQRPLIQLGMDSLMTAELLTAIKIHLAIDLRPSQIIVQHSIHHLAQHILKEWKGYTKTAQPDAPEITENQPPKANDTPSSKELPKSFWQVALFPEVLDHQMRRQQAFKTGIQNPFFIPHQGVNGAFITLNGRQMINYSSYNYLGLAGHPDVIRQTTQALNDYGTSVSASRLASGETLLHQELEEAISTLLGVEKSMVFNSGYLTNAATIGHLLGPSDLVVHDALIHNSALMGSRLSGAQRVAFPHNDWRTLDRMLGQRRGQFEKVMIILEGVYSVDGDLPDLPRFIEVKNRHKALLFIDEAHSIGVLGACGGGIGEHYGIERSQVDVWMGTLSKAFSSCGGYIAGGSALIDYLKYTTPGFVFSVGLSPADSAAALAALKILQQEPQRAHRALRQAQFFRELAQEHHLRIGTSHDSPVIPIIVGDTQKTLALTHQLFAENIFVTPMVPPVVEEETARLRFFLTSEHTQEQIRHTVMVLSKHHRHPPLP